MSYNNASLNYIYDKFKDMMLEDTSQEKSLINQENSYFVVMASESGEPKHFSKHGTTKIQKNFKAGVRPSQSVRPSEIN